jgi:hypothetical protein
MFGKQAALYNVWNAYKTFIINSVADPIYNQITSYATTQGYTLPSATVQAKQKKLIYDLVTSGVWYDLKVFYNFLSDGDAGFALINWKNPTKYLATKQPNVVFTTNQGFSNGASGEKIYTFKPIDVVTEFGLSPTNISYVYEGVFTAIQIGYMFGAVDGNNSVGVFENGAYDNTALNSTPVNNLADGIDYFPAAQLSFVYLGRIGSSDFQFSRNNGTIKTNPSTPNISTPTTLLSVMGADNGVLATNSKAYMLGVAQPDIRGTKLTALYNLWTTYKTSL